MHLASLATAHTSRPSVAHAWPSHGSSLHYIAFTHPHCHKERKKSMRGQFLTRFTDMHADNGKVRVQFWRRLQFVVNLQQFVGYAIHTRELFIKLVVLTLESVPGFYNKRVRRSSYMPKSTKI